ncbi:MAG: iron(III) transport system ATP-binding protein [Colwellia sp.]
MGFNKLNTGELNIKGDHSTLANSIVEDDVVTITQFNHAGPEHRNIGMIFQYYALFPHLTVEKNVLFGIDKLPRNEQKSRMTDLLHLLKLTELETSYPHQLSGEQH